MDGWLQIGKQRLCRSGDLVDLEIVGEVTPTELLDCFGQGILVEQQYGYALILITIMGPWSFPPATRQALARFHREHQTVGATAVVGASSAMRTLIDLVLRAIARLVGRAPLTRFFATRAEALAWLGERRQQGRDGGLGR